MTVNISYFAGAGAQFFDNNGIPLAGGLLYTYSAGTTTPLATYTSNSGSIANSNPIVLDSSGRVSNEIWLTTGYTYKFVLQTAAAVQIGSWDNIPAVNDTTALTTFETNLAGSSGSTYIGYNQGSYGAQTETLQTKLQQILNVFDFMTSAQISDVKANTLTQDVTTPIKNAITAAINTNSNLLFPGGSYKITSTLYPQGVSSGGPATAPYWIGQSDSSQVVISGASISTNIDMIHWEGGSGQAGRYDSWNIEGITIKGSSTTKGLVINGGGSVRAKRCLFVTHLVGLQFSNDGSGYYTEQCSADDCFFENDVTTHVNYYLGAGTNSFRGTGLRHTFHNVNGSVQVINIGTGCEPYNSPLDIDVSYNGTNNQPIILSGTSSGFSATFVGDIRLENFQYPTYIPALATGTPYVFLSGFVQALTGSFTFNNLILTNYASRSNTGSGSLISGGAKTQLKPRTETAVLTAGTSGSFLLPYSALYLNIFGPTLVTVSLSRADGAQYQYSFYAQTKSDGSGGGVIWNNQNTIITGTDLSAYNTFTITSSQLYMGFNYSSFTNNVTVDVTYTPLWSSV
jgi:hypothetical protein